MKYLYFLFGNISNQSDKGFITLVDELYKLQMNSYKVEYEEKNLKEVQRSINDSSKKKTKQDNLNDGAQDYLEKAVRDYYVGNRGEQIVLEYERKRLREAGRHDLSQLIKQVSLNSDKTGYDILSFESGENREERQIEVKTTTLDSSKKAKFFMSSGELEKGKLLSNYWIYIVDLSNTVPKIYSMKNFLNDESKYEIKAVKYEVKVKFEL